MHRGYLATLCVFALPYLDGGATHVASLRPYLAEVERYGLVHGLFGGTMAAGLALADALELRSGRGGSLRRVRKWARWAERSAPYLTNRGLRALAYASDAVGDPEGAIAALRRAEAHAERWSTPVEGAIAQYQLGRRLAGTEGATLVAQARRTVAEHGAAESGLDEDPGLR